MIFVLAAIVFGVFIRRDTVEYYLEHEFSVEDQEFFPSAHALADPLQIRGHKIELLHNGKMIFPTMLEAIRSARESVNFEAFLFRSGFMTKASAEKRRRSLSAICSIRGPITWQISTSDHCGTALPSG
jgi:cardiolipin synthase A/B